MDRLAIQVERDRIINEIVSRSNAIYIKNKMLSRASIVITNGMNNVHLEPGKDEFQIAMGILNSIMTELGLGQVSAELRSPH